MDDALPAVAALTPLVQVALMGFVGYPWARRAPGRLERFEKSGFLWWLLALALVLVLALVTAPHLLAWDAVSKHEVTAARAVIVFTVSVTTMLAFEFIAERLSPEQAAKGRDRYNNVLPSWARPAPVEAALLTGIGALEEGVYRALVLGGAISIWGFSEPAAAALSVASFGAAHWYFGFRQVILKTIMGMILVTTAFASGWVIAALAHVALNLALMGLERRTR